MCMNDLKRIAAELNTTYEHVNLVIYVYLFILIVLVNETQRDEKTITKTVTHKRVIIAKLLILNWLLTQRVYVWGAWGR